VEEEEEEGGERAGQRSTTTSIADNSNECSPRPRRPWGCLSGLTAAEPSPATGSPFSGRGSGTSEVLPPGAAAVLQC
jgi:hypothetical protein